MKPTDYIGIILSLVLILLAGPLVILQAVIFGKVFVSIQLIKLIVAFIFVAMLLINLTSYRVRFSDLLLVHFFLVFLSYNFFTILVFSSNHVGFENAAMAFLYNYSLLIFVLPYYWFSYCSEFYSDDRNEKRKLWRHAFIVFILISDFYGILEFLLHDYLLPTSVIDVLVSGDYIKFDNIGSFIRISSFFKSPLEFGILNVFAAGLFLSKLFSGMKKLFWCPLFLISSLAVFISLSRTVMLMYLVNVSLIVVFCVMITRSKTVLLRNTLRSGLPLLMLFISVSLSFIDLRKFTSVSLNPTNFQIRLENWIGIFYTVLNSAISLIFGIGAVQNMNYGRYHSIVIDNIFLGEIIVGGLVGLLIFIGICGITGFDAFNQVKKLKKDYVFVGFACFSFFISFLAGGMTENLMHIIFYPFMVLQLIKMMPQKHYPSHYDGT